MEVVGPLPAVLQGWDSEGSGPRAGQVPYPLYSMSTNDIAVQTREPVSFGN